jgi:hypothetical protein
MDAPARTGVRGNLIEIDIIPVWQSYIIQVMFDSTKNIWNYILVAHGEYLCAIYIQVRGVFVFNLLNMTSRSNRLVAFQTVNI